MVLFKEWLLKHFLRYAGANHLLDGHSSHYNLEAINLAKENDVIMFTYGTAQAQRRTRSH